MAKGMYSFVSYPESSDIKKICDAIQGAGGEYAYILHDKDTWDSDGKDHQGNEHKSGDLKKAHYHILAGWDTGFPNWKKFKALCDSVGAVAVSRDKCLVKNPYSMFKYLTHESEES